jgi:PEGA domain-containing protein
MTRATRRLLSFLAWLAFLIAAPLLIAYALGHRIRPSIAPPEQVGAFLIRTTPNNAHVTIDGAARSKTTPTSVGDLLSRPYTVRLEKDGYRRWEKRLDILGTKVTDIGHVRLIPKNPEEQSFRDGVSDIAAAPNGRTLAVVERSRSGTHLRFIPAASLADGGIVADLAIEPGQRFSFLWSPDSARTAAVLQTAIPRVSLIDAISGAATPLPGARGIVGWTTNNRLVVLAGSELRLYPGTGQPRVLSHTAQAAAVTGSRVLVVEQRGSDPLTLRELSEDGALVNSVPAPPGVGAVESVTASPFGDLALLTNPQRQLLLWHAERHQWAELAGHAENVVWAPDGEKLLWQSSEFDLWVANIRERRTVLPQLSPLLLLRHTSPIRTPRWFAGSQHVLFFQNDLLRLMEIDPRDGHHTEDLLGTNRGDAEMAVLDDGHVLFATARRDGRDVLLREYLLTPEDR